MKSLDWSAIQQHERRLTKRILDGLAVVRGVRVLGPTGIENRRGVVSFVMEGLSVERIGRHMDSLGVALRGGHHCAQPLIRAFGVGGAVRASLAPYSLDEDRRIAQRT
jgi:cysteine desulfurase/selenocysteine lyase